MKVRRSFSSGRRVRKPLSVSLLTVLAMTLLSSERRLVILCFFDSFCAFLSRVYRFSGFRISDGGPAFYGGRLFGLRFRRHDAGRRCAAAACGDQKHQPLCADRFHRNGVRSFRRNTDSKPHEQPGGISDRFCHDRCGADSPCVRPNRLPEKKSAGRFRCGKRFTGRRFRLRLT